MWSKPREEYTTDDRSNFFSDCNDCENKVNHICKYDNVPFHIKNLCDYILSYDIYIFQF